MGYVMGGWLARSEPGLVSLAPSCPSSPEGGSGCPTLPAGLEGSRYSIEGAHYWAKINTKQNKSKLPLIRGKLFLQFLPVQGFHSPKSPLVSHRPSPTNSKQVLWSIGLLDLIVVKATSGCGLSWLRSLCGAFGSSCHGHWRPWRQHWCAPAGAEAHQIPPGIRRSRVGAGPR